MRSAKKLSFARVDTAHALYVPVFVSQYSCIREEIVCSNASYVCHVIPFMYRPGNWNGIASKLTPLVRN